MGDVSIVPSAMLHYGGTVGAGFGAIGVGCEGFGGYGLMQLSSPTSLAPCESNVSARSRAPEAAMSRSSNSSMMPSSGVPSMASEFVPSFNEVMSDSVPETDSNPTSSSESSPQRGGSSCIEKIALVLPN